MNPLTLIKDAKDAALRLRRDMEATKTTKTQQDGTLKAVRAAIVEKRAELERADRAYLPRTEYLARFNASVDAEAARYEAERGSGFLESFGRPKPSSMIRPMENDPWGALCFFAGPMVKESMARGLRPYEEGAPAEARPALVKRLAQELGELERLEEEAVDGMIADGIVVEHRPEVKARRETEHRAAEQTAAANAERKAREDAINAAHEQRPRTAHSQYLAGKPQ